LARKPTPEFKGTDRYEIRRTLGVGGMGVVYEAYDRERGIPVALKTLRKVDPAAIYRFKREFRAVVDANHPNLVRLFELVQDDKGRCFFTMEMVGGVDFLRWVGHETWPGADTRTGIARTSEKRPKTASDRPEPPPPAVDDASPEPTGAAPPIIATENLADAPSQVHTEVTRNWKHGTSVEFTAPTAEIAREDRPKAPVLLEKRLPQYGKKKEGTYTPARVGFDGESFRGLDIPRLRSALRQLVEGISALHSIGCLHRDIKPSNVLVTPEGRLVLLDLGLVTMMAPAEASIERYVAGTAAYMSPEQATARTLTEASDWYSVGVMLHEALTASRPFRGRFEHVIKAKQGPEPPPPSHFVPGVPADLDELCVALLKKRPKDRPTGKQILDRLLAGEASDPGMQATAARLAPVQAGVRGAPFVGRADDLQLLRDAFDRRGRGEAVTVHMTGPSGLGKSALLRRFLDEATVRRKAVVVIGRCYASESVPFKALDGVVDSLSRHLRSLKRVEVEAVLPRGIAALAQVFPVLRQVEAVAATPGASGKGGGGGLDPDELRSRAFTAFRELVARIADRRPLIMAVDDLQWGDEAGVKVLTELTRSADPPRLLLVLGYRSDGVEADGPLAELRTVHGLPAVPRGTEKGEGFVHEVGNVVELRLGRLKPGEARELATRLLGDDRPEWAAAVEAESAGNPLFVEELVRWTQEAADEPGDDDEVRLDDVLRSRIDALDAGARGLLETVAISGRPMARRLAFAAAGLKESDQAEIQALLGGRLLRTGGGDETTLLEPFHDRIREAVLLDLAGPGLRARHLQLAKAMESLGSGDAETLTEHFCGAGELDRAGVYAVAAARQAGSAGSLGRAATLYRLALRLRPDGEDRRALRGELADALARGGRGAEAAEEFLALAADSPADEALALEHRAASQYLDAGRLHEALGRLEALALRLDLEVPRERAVVRRSSWMRKLRSVLGGGESDPPRGPAVEDALEQRRVDVLEGFVEALRVLDPARALLVSERRLAAARGLADRARWARAAAAHAALLAGEGAGNSKAVFGLLAGARGVLAEADDVVTRAVVFEAEAEHALQDGAWKAAGQRFEAAREALAGGRRHGWLRARIGRSAAIAELQRGRLRSVRARVRVGLEDAEARGDLVFVGALRSGSLVLHHLAHDDTGSARAGVAAAMQPFRNQAYLLPNFEGALADTMIDLYVGDAPAAWRRVERNGERLARSFLLTRRDVGVRADFLRARAALAAAALQLRAAAGDEVAGHLLQPPPTPTAAPAPPLPSPATLLAEARRIAKRLEKSRDEWVTAVGALVTAGERAASGEPRDAAATLTVAAERFDRCGMALYAAAARLRLAEVTGTDDRDARAVFEAEGVVHPGRLADLLAPGFPPPTP